MSPSLDDDLPPPPPSILMHENNSPHNPHITKKPVAAPVSVNGKAPILKPKPSVKSVNSDTSNSSSDIVTNLRKISVNSPPGELQGDQSELVTSSKSRGKI